MKKFRKAAAVFIAVAVICAMLFSFLFITKEAGHECSGSECAICGLIRSCVENFSSALKSQGVFAVMILLMCLCVIVHDIKQEQGSTPVILKVRLLN